MRVGNLVWTLAILAITGAPAMPLAAGPAKSHLTVTFASKPAPPKLGDNEFIVTVKDDHETPISDADVIVRLVKSGMAEMRNDVTLKPTSPGTYVGTGQVAKSGTWKVTISVRRAGTEVVQKALKLTAEK